MATVVRAFRYTGSSQSWVVPVGTTSARFELWGASGGSWLNTARVTPAHNDELTMAAYYEAGKPTAFGASDMGSNGGGYVAGDRAVTAGDTYLLYVGGNGQNGYNGSGQYTAAGGYNGGGKGGMGHNFGSLYGIGGGGGGGATDVRFGGSALANRILVAGGSGGNGGATLNGGVTAPALPIAPWTIATTSPVPPFGSATYAQREAVGYEHFQHVYVRGGAYGAGGSAGNYGVNGWWSGSYGSGGGGGGSAAGGYAGAAHSGGGVAGTAGTLGVAGNGGSAGATGSTTLSAPTQGGGGGGGGLYGGGGGGTGGASGGWYPGGGGGGGSNYIAGSGAFTNTYSGVFARPPSPTALSMAGAIAGFVTTQPGGLARLTYDVKPHATLVTPVTGAPIPSNKAILATVEFTHPDGVTADGTLISACAGADLRWSVASAGVWTQVHLDAPAGSSSDAVVDMTYSIPSGTFTAGTSYDIQARTYDTAGDISDWTSITVLTLAAPTAPTLTAPSVGSNQATPFNVTWTNPNSLPEGNEVLYRVLLQSPSHVVDAYLNSGVRLNYATNPDCKTNTTGYTVNAPDALTYDAVTTDPWAVAGCEKITWGSGGSGICLLGQAGRPAGRLVTTSIYIKSATTGAPPMKLLAKTGLFGDDIAVSAPLAASTSWQRISITYVSSGTDVLFVLVDTPATAGTITYLSSYLVEDEDSLLPYFGKTTKDPAITGTLGTSAAGFAYLTGTGAAQTLSYTVDSTVWPWGPDNVTVSVSIATVGSQGFFSDPSTRAFIINTNPPGTPTGSLTVDNTAGTVTLSLHAVDTPNSTLYMDIFRAPVSDPTQEIRIAKELPPDASRNIVYVDYTPADSTPYQYRVRAYSSSGGFADLT
jgi:hypothetical protein